MPKQPNTADLKIHTTYHSTPDTWTANFDGYDGSDDAGNGITQLTGWGQTEAGAIEDLQEQAAVYGVATITFEDGSVSVIEDGILVSL